jgi:hypothetical protein
MSLLRVVVGTGADAGTVERLGHPGKPQGDDCPMMAAAAGEGTPVHDSGATDSQGLGGHCSVCQLCMSLAGVDCVPIRSPGVGTLKPEPHASRFSSADPAREHRPPIS